MFQIVEINMFTRTNIGITNDRSLNDYGHNLLKTLHLTS